jgi:hypothetical protein
VELPKGVLRDIRCLHDYLVEQLIVAARRGIDGRLIDDVGRSASLRLYAVARLIQALGNDYDFIDWRGKIRSVGGGSVARSRLARSSVGSRRSMHWDEDARPTQYGDHRERMAPREPN